MTAKFKRLMGIKHESDPGNLIRVFRLTNLMIQSEATNTKLGVYEMQVILHRIIYLMLISGHWGVLSGLFFYCLVKFVKAFENSASFFQQIICALNNSLKSVESFISVDGNCVKPYNFSQRMLHYVE